MHLTVVLPTHNPHPGRLRRTLEGLARQTLSRDRWDLVIVDNASIPPVTLPPDLEGALPSFEIAHERELGLTAARRRGFSEAKGDLLVLVDDDNVLAPDYLAHAVRLFETHPRIGAAGGRILPEFESSAPVWIDEFQGLLACRDLGDVPRIGGQQRDVSSGRNTYPEFSPVGAGMALRRSALQGWLAVGSDVQLSDRRGSQLTSGGDNDIVFTVLREGWEVGYFPELRLTHLIPASRLSPEYLGRLNRGIQRSWIHVLTRHGANPWSPISGWSVLPRQIKAWFAYRAWSGPAAAIRWHGACGHFEGRRQA